MSGMARQVARSALAAAPAAAMPVPLQSGHIRDSSSGSSAIILGLPCWRAPHRARWLTYHGQVSIRPWLRMSGRNTFVGALPLSRSRGVRSGSTSGHGESRSKGYRPFAGQNDHEGDRNSRAAGEFRRAGLTIAPPLRQRSLYVLSAAARRQASGT